MFKKQSLSTWAGLALTALLLAAGLVLVFGLASAQEGITPSATTSREPPSYIDQVQAPAAPDGDGVWTPLGGPLIEGGQVLGLAVHPTISGTVYAAVSPIGAYDSGPSTVYKSTDGAATWTPVYTSQQQIYSLAVTGTLVYAGCFNPGDEGASILASYDSGLTWAPVFTATDRGVWLDISIHPTDTNEAIIGGWFYHQLGPDRVQSGLVYGTNDGGMTWTPLLTATVPGAEATINAVMMHPVTPTLLLASMHTWGGPADQDSYVYRSTDAGATWPISVTMPNAHVVSLVANTTDPDMIYAGAGFGPFTNGRAVVFRSTDAGLSYNEVHSEGTYLAFEPPSTVYTVMDTGQNYVSTSSGDPGTWQEVGYAQGNVHDFAIDLGPSPANQYAGLMERGMSKGIYGGGPWNWDLANNGIGTLSTPRDIDVDPQNPDKIFAAAECGRGWLSGDGGQTWVEPSGLAGCMYAFAINPDDPDIVYGGAHDCSRGAVLRSGDGGLNFEPVFTATFVITDCSGGGEQLYDLAIAASMTSTVYAAGLDQPGWSNDQAVIVRSVDDGASWTKVFTLPEPSRVETLAIDPTDADTVYASGEDCSGTSGPPCTGFVYRTTDGGSNWTPVFTMDGGSVRSIAVDYQKPDILYISHNYDIYKSTDGGDSWTLIRPCCPSGYLLTMDPHVPSHVYLGGWGYIAETPDNGQTWNDWQINNGTPPMEPRSLAVDNGTLTQTLYAGFTGVWAYSRPAPQPGEAVTMDMFTDPPTGPLVANGLNDVRYFAHPLDEYGNWLANGTPVTVTYEWEWDGGGMFETVKTIDKGYVTGGWMGVSSAGTITFTASANLTATAFVTMDFIAQVHLPIVLRNY